MNNKNIYLVPFNNNLNYLDPYKKLFKNRIKLLLNPLDIFLIPLFSTLLIEDIHKFSLMYFIRLDLYIVHIPRGGGTFKIGWKDTKPRFHIWLRLWRRNKVILCSEMFIDFFKSQEKIKFYQKIDIFEEPIVTVSKELYKLNNSRPISNVLIMLGDRSSDIQYTQLVKQLSKLYNVSISVHPRRKTSLTNSKYSWNDIDLVIVDASVSITTFLQSTGIRYLVLSDIESSRKMWITKENLYLNMVESKNLKLRISQGPYTKLKHKLSNKSLITKF
jgi:hypothetical protein